MRPATRLLKHVPLIRFVGGPHVASKHSSTPQPHPMAPDGALPKRGGSGSSYVNSNPVEPKEGQYFSRAELSARFRYKFPKVEEVEDINSGGATWVF